MQVHKNNVHQGNSLYDFINNIYNNNYFIKLYKTNYMYKTKYVQIFKFISFK